MINCEMKNDNFFSEKQFQNMSCKQYHCFKEIQNRKLFSRISIYRKCCRNTGTNESSQIHPPHLILQVCFRGGTIVVKLLWSQFYPELLLNTNNYFYFYTLCEKCPSTEFFWSVFSRTRTEYGDLRSKYRPEKTPYLDTFHAVIILNISLKRD